MEYTPGPWIAIPPDENCRDWFISRDRLDAPIGVIPKHLRDGIPYYIAVFGSLMSPKRAEANAHLIAAAPDLLAACEAVGPFVARYAYLDPDGDCLIIQVADAIAKAEGGGE